MTDMSGNALGREYCAVASQCRVTGIGTSRGSAEATPVRGDDEKHASEGERNACDDRSRRRHLEGWDLSGDEPDSGEQDQQEPDFGEGYASSMAESKHGTHGSDVDPRHCRVRSDV